MPELQVALILAVGEGIYRGDLISKGIDPGPKEILSHERIRRLTRAFRANSPKPTG